MQISGSNLLASQQVAQAGSAMRPAAPGFSAALQKAAGFLPRDLTLPEPAADAKPAAQAAPARPGSQIDIKV